MKLAYQIFSVILLIAIALAALNFVLTMKRFPEVTLPIVIGGLLGNALIPGIIWLIRFYIGKDLKKRIKF